MRSPQLGERTEWDPPRTTTRVSLAQKLSPVLRYRKDESPALAGIPLPPHSPETGKSLGTRRAGYS